MRFSFPVQPTARSYPFLTPPPAYSLVKRGAQTKYGRSEQHDKNTGKNEKYQREKNLDLGLGGSFLRPLTARRASLLSVAAESTDDRRGETIRLLQHRDQGDELLQFGAV